MEEGHEKTPYALTPEQYGSFLIRLFRLWYKDLKKGRQPFIRTFENYVALAAGYQAEACEQRGICGLQYVVEADGSVYPCDFYMLDDYRLGNFNQDLLDVIDKKREEIGFISRSREIPEGCAACPTIYSAGAAVSEAGIWILQPVFTIITSARDTGCSLMPVVIRSVRLLYNFSLVNNRIDSGRLFCRLFRRNLFLALFPEFFGSGSQASA